MHHIQNILKEEEDVKENQNAMARNKTTKNMYINRTQSACKIYKIENRIFCIKLQSNDNNINRNRARYSRQWQTDYLQYVSKRHRNNRKRTSQPYHTIPLMNEWMNQICDNRTWYKNEALIYTFIYSDA